MLAVEKEARNMGLGKHLLEVFSGFFERRFFERRFFERRIFKKVALAELRRKGGSTVKTDCFIESKKLLW